MSLHERLAKISENLKKNKEEEEKARLKDQLAPIRDLVKELEDKRRQLDVIKGSLESNPSVMQGRDKNYKTVHMKDYAEITTKTASETTDQSDSLMDKHKEALEVLGVENRDQLVDHQELADEPEIVNYKKAQSQLENLTTDDKALEERLKSLGVDMKTEDFSYDVAEKALAEKIKAIDTELLNENLKTPEGKQEAINELTENFGGSLDTMHFSLQNN